MRLLLMDQLELILNIFVIPYLLAFSSHVFLKTRKLEPAQKRYNYGIAFFLLVYAFCRVLFLLNDLLMEETGDVSLKYGSIYVLGNFCASMATFSIMVVVEKYVIEKKFRFIPSLIILVSASMMLIFPRINSFNLVTYYVYASSLTALLIPILYLIVGFRVVGKPRVKSFLLAFALSVFMIGIMFNTGMLKDAIPIFRYLSPMTVLAGMMIFHYALLIF